MPQHPTCPPRPRRRCPTCTTANAPSLTSTASRLSRALVCTSIPKRWTLPSKGWCVRVCVVQRIPRMRGPTGRS